jgi:glycosyltransferase involved in cell wall biosynthesis
MSEPGKTANSSIKFRKVMGRTYLHEDRLKDAVDVFLGILRDDPEDVDTLLELGNLYLASGNGRTAAQLFHKVLSLEPERKIIEKQLALAAIEEEQDLPEEPVPTDPEAISRMLQRLTGKSEPFSDQEIHRAYEMLQSILASPHPADEVAERLDEIGSLLPALIELNIIQARADGQPGIAEALQNLQINIALQKNPSADDNGKYPVRKAGAAYRRRFKGYVLLLVPDWQHISGRVALACNALRSGGCKVQVADSLRGLTGPRPDVVIASNPHLNPANSGDLAAFTEARIPVIVDLEADFENIPVYHPGYGEMGLGRKASSQAYVSALAAASAITAPSGAMVSALRGAGYPARYLPHGWERDGGQRPKEARQRAGLRLGWAGCGQPLEDIALIRRVLIRVLYEFENVQVVIMGSAAAYQLFDSVPDSQKIYLPCATPEEQRAHFGQIDIFLAPMRTHPFNDTRSDEFLVEAGARAIPWVASPVPAFYEWGKGGLIATTREEWHTYLRQLVMDADLRSSLGREGSLAAGQRESKRIGDCWTETIEQVLGRLPENLTIEPAPARLPVSVHGYPEASVTQPLVVHS